MNPDTDPVRSNLNWERNILEKLASEGLAEQRRRRRWGILFKFLTFAYLTFFLLAFIGIGAGGQLGDGKPHTALVRMTGIITNQGAASAERVTAALQSAFEAKGVVGVVLLINSPGGSPVQAGIINDEIHRLRKKYPNIPINAVVEDVCASGGYYVAVAADNIYVDKASLVGSIGVLMDGFGFTGTMEKLGIERRLLSAGDNKGFLDPFSPLSPRHKVFAQQMLGEIHQQFITVVREGRGKRLKETPETFSGLIWSGARSVEMGLADGFGTVDSVARDIYKAENVRDYTIQPTLSEKIAKQFGAEVADNLLGSQSRVNLR